MRVPVTVVDARADNASPEALVTTFESLLEETDRGAFFGLLGIGRFSLSRKKSMLPVFTALCTGLWRLALQRAVPDGCEAAYARYLDSLWPKVKDADAYMVLVRDMAGHLPERGDADFTPTAREVFRRAGREPAQAELVGMALFLRRLYDYFFNHLM